MSQIGNIFDPDSLSDEDFSKLNIEEILTNCQEGEFKDAFKDIESDGLDFNYYSVVDFSNSNRQPLITSYDCDPGRIGSWHKEYYINIKDINVDVDGEQTNTSLDSISFGLSTVTFLEKEDVAKYSYVIVSTFTDGANGVTDLDVIRFK